MILEDNEGENFLSKNKQVSQRTKHIDLRYHFLREFTEKGQDTCGQEMMMKVHGEENYADLLTKNKDQRTLEYLGEYIDEGLIRNRDEVYNANISQ